MQAAQRTYLQFVDYPSLINWSTRYLINKDSGYNKSYALKPLSSFLTKSRDIVNIQDDVEYRRVTVRIKGGGVLLRDKEIGKNIGTKRQFIAKAGQFVISKIDARNGAMGIVPAELGGAIVTNDFPLFDVNVVIVNPDYLRLITTTETFIKIAHSSSSGTTNRQRVNVDNLLQHKIPLPSLAEQEKLVADYNKKINEAAQLSLRGIDLEGEIEKYLFDQLGIYSSHSSHTKSGLNFVDFENLYTWGIDKNQVSLEANLNFKVASFDKNPNLFIEIYRGKSPNYDANSNSIILNQKCNRWNKIDLQFAKRVNESWIKGMSETFFTKTGDILINSTGEGTIGRSSYVSKEYEGLLYDSHILLLRLNSNIVNPEFFVEVFNSSYVQKQIDIIKSAQSTKQTELGIANLKKVSFPVPPMETQHNIVEEIKELRRHLLHGAEKSELLKLQAQQEFEQAIFS